jgi:hypothetical protein
VRLDPCVLVARLHSATPSQFTIRSSSFTIAHAHRCTCSGATHPCGSHPASYASGALTAEEWTRQSTSLPCCCFGCLLCFDACSRCFPLLLLCIAASQLLAVTSFTGALRSPSASQARLACSGVERFARFGQVASLHSQLL